MVGDSVKRAFEKTYMMDFEENQRLPISEMREINERRGYPVRLAVPFYDQKTGKWIDDPKYFCDPEKAYREAVQPHWYERVLNFFRK